MIYEKISSRNPEEVEQLAVSASKNFLKGNSKAKLQDSILEVIKHEKGLTEEHIRRICENTNSTVLQNLLKTERERTIGFPLADPSILISSYNEAQEIKPRNLSDYDLPPQLVLKEDLKRKEDLGAEATKEIISKLPTEVTDDPNYINPIRKAAEQHDRFELAEGWISSKLATLSHEYKSAEQEIKGTLYSSILGNLMSVHELEKIAEDLPEVKPYLREVFLRFARTGDLLRLQDFSTDKYASSSEEVELALDHPLVRAIEQLSTIQKTVDALTESLDIIRLKKSDARQVMMHGRR